MPTLSEAEVLAVGTAADGREDLVDLDHLLLASTSMVTATRPPFFSYPTAFAPRRTFMPRFASERATTTRSPLSVPGRMPAVI